LLLGWERNQNALLFSEEEPENSEKGVEEGDKECEKVRIKKT